MSEPLFPIGRMLITSNAQAILPTDEVLSALGQHSNGDWGDVGEEDWATNERALKEGERLLSAYKTAKGVKFWIITEADRSVTTVLLPEDY